MPSDPTTLPVRPSLLHRLFRWVLRLFPRATRESAMEALREDIAGAIALGHSEGAVEKADRDRLLGALDLSHRTVEVHRARLMRKYQASTAAELVQKLMGGL